MVERVTVLLTPDGLLEGVYEDYEDAKEKAKESNITMIIGFILIFLIN